ncbi:AraC-type DNA-binding protein [Filimonas lacunae]|uniref:AraC-type DNA-binding protein n=1 Tax=Filimonas lacunae TaxID=477680 RepID=A0A173MIQ2_9BACT|nr:helix-turn-helix transcriptional regulator [Filimonas lacunae]BAV07346.1 transcriptional regulator, AraC family [Filimonas lacunae]SIS91022.1 AraC-type DNA-binding protein [Filimonas lacunae]
MKKEEANHYKFSSISDAHKYFGLPKPKHPLISLIRGSHHDAYSIDGHHSHVLAFYKIAFKSKLDGSLRYGQGHYDFDEGGLLFASPNQIIGHNNQKGFTTEEMCGCTLLIHPDFLLNYPIAKKIKQYGFFSYAVNETLHLSESEKETILGIFRMIEEELNSRIDDFSHDVVIAQIELLFNYANRFYKRQFITRQAVSNNLLQKLEDYLNDYFSQDTGLHQGLPSVQHLAEHVNLTPSYLSDMLRSLIGSNAQQYIHNKLIEKAKETLSTTSLTVSEVAYQLGFEHSQSFSKLFKSKTNLSPLEFRRSFN